MLRSCDLLIIKCLQEEEVKLIIHQLTQLSLLSFCLLGSSQPCAPPTPHYPQYPKPDTLPLIPNQIPTMPPQYPNPQYIPNPQYPYPFMINPTSLKGSINPASNPVPLNPSSSNITPYLAPPPVGDGVPAESSPLPPPGGHTMPPNTQTPGMWPVHSQEPLFSLANVLSLAMTMAQSFIPPTTLPNSLPQAYIPPQAPQPGYPGPFGPQHPGAAQKEAPPHQEIHMRPEAQSPAPALSATTTAPDVPGLPGAGDQTGMSPQEGQGKIASSSLPSCKSSSSAVPQTAVSAWI